MEVVEENKERPITTEEKPKEGPSTRDPATKHENNEEDRQPPAKATEVDESANPSVEESGREGRRAGRYKEADVLEP